MKKTNALRIMLTVLFAGCASAPSTGASSAPASSAPTAEDPAVTAAPMVSGDWYIDLTHSDEFVDGETAYTSQDLNELVKGGTWYLDEASFSVKSELQPESALPFGAAVMSPENYPVASRYYAYRFLTRVGQSWERIPDSGDRPSNRPVCSRIRTDTRPYSRSLARSTAPPSSRAVSCMP